jgi:hypothetical protein
MDISVDVLNEARLRHKDVDAITIRQIMGTGLVIQTDESEQQ